MSSRLLCLLVVLSAWTPVLAAEPKAESKPAQSSSPVSPDGHDDEDDDTSEVLTTQGTIVQLERGIAYIDLGTRKDCVQASQCKSFARLRPSIL